MMQTLAVILREKAEKAGSIDFDFPERSNIGRERDIRRILGPIDEMQPPEL